MERTLVYSVVNDCLRSIQAASKPLSLAAFKDSYKEALQFLEITQHCQEGRDWVQTLTRGETMLLPMEPMRPTGALSAIALEITRVILDPRRSLAQELLRKRDAMLGHLASAAVVSILEETELIRQYAADVIWLRRLNQIPLDPRCSSLFETSADDPSCVRAVWGQDKIAIGFMTDACGHLWPPYQRIQDGSRVLLALLTEDSIVLHNLDVRADQFFINLTGDNLSLLTYYRRPVSQDFVPIGVRTELRVYRNENPLTTYVYEFGDLTSVQGEYCPMHCYGAVRVGRESFFLAKRHNGEIAAFDALRGVQTSFGDVLEELEQVHRKREINR